MLNFLIGFIAGIITTILLEILTYLIIDKLVTNGKSDMDRAAFKWSWN